MCVTLMWLDLLRGGGPREGFTGSEEWIGGEKTGEAGGEEGDGGVTGICM